VKTADGYRLPEQIDGIPLASPRGVSATMPMAMVIDETDEYMGVAAARWPEPLPRWDLDRT
jgi:hypothetical protein